MVSDIWIGMFLAYGELVQAMRWRRGNSPTPLGDLAQLAIVSRLRAARRWSSRPIAWGPWVNSSNSPISIANVAEPMAMADIHGRGNP